MEELKKLSSDDVFANLYDVEEFRQAQEKEIRTKATEQGMKEGYIQGFEQGSKEGFEQGSKEGFEQGSKEGFEQGSKEGFDQGIEQGIEDGIEIKTKDDAINLYHNGVSEDVICKSLNITPEKLQIYIKASN